MDRKELFRQYDRFDENTFYEFLKQIHYKFPKCCLFLDKASQHYKSHKVRQYFEQHRNDLVPVFGYLQHHLSLWYSKNLKDLLVLTYYHSFTNFRKKIGEYFRTKHFNLNMRNYLVGKKS